MPGEEQERFEDYLELEKYIEELQAGRVAHPPANIPPEQVHIYRMAALFRSASPDATMPRPEFVASLQADLLALVEETSVEASEQVERTHQDTTLTPPPDGIKRTNVDSLMGEEEIQRPSSLPAKRKRAYSRRTLLTGGAVAAASLTVGASVGMVVVQSNPGSAPPTEDENAYQTPLVNEGVLHFVAPLNQVRHQAIRFVTDAVIGYVIRSKSHDGKEDGEIIAMSASCTHMGCIVQWQESDQQFHCPCHNGKFNAYGKPVEGRQRYRAPLARLKTVIQDEKVYVVVPKNTSL